MTAAASTCAHQGPPTRLTPRPPIRVPAASIRNVNSRVTSSMMMNSSASTSQAIQRYCVRSGSTARLLPVALPRTLTPLFRLLSAMCPVGRLGVMSHPIPAGALAGRTALVTGSSRGIGADTVRYFAQAGANVVINFRNKAPRAQKLATELSSSGVEALVVGADLTDADSVAEMFAAVEERFGSLDILVLNASGGMEGGMAEDYAMTAQPRRAGRRARRGDAAARRRIACRVRHEPPGPLHPHHADHAGVRGGRAVQARR